MTRRLASFVALILFGSALGACSFFSMDAHRSGFYLVNRTEQPVDVRYQMGSEAALLADDVPHGSLMINGFDLRDCPEMEMVATDQTGAVVATFSGRVCDQMRWEIDAAAPSASG